MKYFQLPLALCFLLVGLPACAKDNVLLSEDIYKFYKKMNEIQNMPTKDIIVFYDDHTYPEFTMTMKIPIADIKNNTLKYEIQTLGKLEFFDAIKNKRRIANFVGVEIKIIDIKLGKNKQSATVTEEVRTEHYIKGMGQVFSFESCEDSISLIKGVIQIVKKECELVVK